MKHESDHFERDMARPIEIAREVARLARSVLGQDAEVIWFGSWPQGMARPHSDIDVAISTGTPISPERMAVLQGEVDEIPTLYEIDIVDLNAMGSTLREEILKHGQRL
jgi:predicted nucleotidyltransferase